MDVTVIGIPDRNLDHLVAAARSALASLGLPSTLSTVTDPDAIAEHSLSRTPAILVDGDLLVSGEVPSRAAIEELLAARAQSASPGRRPPG